MIKNIVIITNGHGEDGIALNLVKAIQKHVPQSNITVIPLVGSGKAYTQAGLTPALTNPVFPSGGFIRTLKDALSDIKAGLITHMMYQRKEIKQLAKQADICIGVGDIFCLWMARAASLENTYFLPTAKSDAFMAHNVVERWYIKKVAQVTFPRDEQTASTLKRYQIKAEYHGNPMMDNLLTQRKAVELDKGQVLIGMLPGSREEAYQNVDYFLNIAEQLAKDAPHVRCCIAKASTLELSKMAIKAGWDIQQNEKSTMLYNGKASNKVYISDDFLAVINQAKVVVGLAGTANEQAAFLGKPVICFKGFGPQASQQRFMEQKKLMGNNIIFIEQNISIIIKEIDLQLTKNTQKSPEQSASSKITKKILKII